MNILVTGGASGLGESITKKLLSNENNTVYFTFCGSKDNADKISYDFPNSRSLKCDFNDLENVNSLCKMIPSLELDVLINNAYSGNYITKHFNRIPLDDFSTDFIKNTIPTILITQSAISYFKKVKNGKIITILTSALVNHPIPGASSYIANKAYLQSLTKSWAIENKKFNITSNSVSPSLMQTKLTSDIDERIIEQIINTHPLKKILTTTEVAESVEFLVNSSQQINGINLVINSAESIS
tara:strand:- start:444 stop:1166 length:723 start_codon:yes stop_codon:yes gene_type:complete